MPSGPGLQPQWASLGHRSICFRLKLCRSVPKHMCRPAGASRAAGCADRTEQWPAGGEGCWEAWSRTSVNRPTGERRGEGEPGGARPA